MLCLPSVWHYAEETEMNVQQRTDKSRAVDHAALDSMIATYAGPVFRRLFAHYGDREIAIQALKETLFDIFNTMQAVDCANPLEAVIYDRARSRQNELISHAIEQSINDTLDQMKCQNAAHDLEESSILPAAIPTEADPVEKAAVIETCHTLNEDADSGADKESEQAPVPVTTMDREQSKAKKRRHMGPGAVLLIVLLSIGIIAMVWLIVGLVMSVGVLPRADWGYQWFNMNIAPWFS